MTTKVLLIYPIPSISSPQKSPPLSILYVGQALKEAKLRGKSDEDYQVQYFDERYDNLPDMDWPDVVGVSSMTGYQLKGAIRWLKEAKRYNKRTILGGIHVTMQPEQCLQEDYIDSIVLSEGEWAILDAIHGKEITKHPLNGEHVSPVAPETLIHFKRASRTGDNILLTSRGCPFRCGFSVREDTIIETPSGEWIARDILVGDIVLGWNEKENNIVPTQVVSIDNPNVLEEIEIELDDGSILICSPEHPIMTRRGWVLAGELLDTDEVLAQSHS